MNVFCKLSLICFALWTGNTNELKVIRGDCQYDSNIKAYTSVEQMPEYPGGTIAFLKVFAKNFYIDTTDLQPTVIPSFVVMPNGKLTNFGIFKKVKTEFTATDKEAIRVMRLMPKWKAGTCNGKKVPVKMTLRIITEPQW